MASIINRAPEGAIHAGLCHQISWFFLTRVRYMLGCADACCLRDIEGGTVVVVVERRNRKWPILTPSSLPCLGNMPTINITEGCVHNCAYCYTQGYRSYPGPGRVVLFDNIPELLRAELPRKRKRPHRVYFSPSSDAFQPLGEVQDVTFETMSILLAGGVEAAFLTKGVVNDRFAALFAESPTSVHAQVGVTTTNRRLWQLLEAGAACPADRLQTIERLTRAGLTVSPHFSRFFCPFCLRIA
jgi:DNA repair photolyase